MRNRVYLLLPYEGSENGPEVKYQCPRCMRHSLAWNIETHIGHCFICHKGYNLKSIKRICKINHLRTVVNHTTPTPIEAAVGARNWVNQLPPEAIAFLEAEKRIQFPNNYFQWCQEKQQIAVRLTNCLDPNNFDARITRSIHYKGWYVDHGLVKSQHIYCPQTVNPQAEIVIPHPDSLHTQRPMLVLVEGPFDAISIAQARPGVIVISLLGATAYESQVKYLLAKYRDFRWAVWFDPDKAGQIGAFNFGKMLKFGYGKHLNIIHTDQEPNDCTQQKILRTIHDAFIVCS